MSLISPIDNCMALATIYLCMQCKLKNYKMDIVTGLKFYKYFYWENGEEDADEEKEEKEKEKE